jgi:hypothetical protein
MFLAQDYALKELIILDDGVDPIGDVVPRSPTIRYIREEPGKHTLGAKRNIACEYARGDIILHWDDDDWYASWRIRYQVEFLEAHGVDICSLDRAFFMDVTTKEVWEFVHPNGTSNWLCGATLCYRRSLWQERRFADVGMGEDSKFIRATERTRRAAVGNNRFFVCRIHGRNTCTRPPGGRWPRRTIEEVQEMVGADWSHYFGESDCRTHFVTPVSELWAAP